MVLGDQLSGGGLIGTGGERTSRRQYTFSQVTFPTFLKLFLHEKLTNMWDVTRSER